MNRLVTTTLGLLAVAWPLPWAPTWTYPLAILGALATLPVTRVPVLAASTAIVASAFSDAGAPVLAAEGLFILAYLLTATAPPAMPRPARWLRHQIPRLVSALIATGASLAAFAVHPATSTWLTVTGIVAAVAAYLIALPGRSRAAAAPAGPQAAAAGSEQTDPALPARTGTA